MAQLLIESRSSENELAVIEGGGMEDLVRLRTTFSTSEEDQIILRGAGIQPAIGLVVVKGKTLIARVGAILPLSPYRELQDLRRKILDYMANKTVELAQGGTIVPISAYTLSHVENLDGKKIPNLSFYEAMEEVDKIRLPKKLWQVDKELDFTSSGKEEDRIYKAVRITSKSLVLAPNEARVIYQGTSRGKDFVLNYQEGDVVRFDYFK